MDIDNCLSPPFQKNESSSMGSIESNRLIFVSRISLLLCLQ